MPKLGDHQVSCISYLHFYSSKLNYYYCTSFSSSLSNNDITSVGSSALFDAVRDYCPLVTTVNLMDTNIDDNCIRSLSSLVSQSTSLKSLSLGIKSFTKGGITDKGMEEFAQSIIGNQSLKKVELSFFNDITEKSVPFIEEMISKSCISAFDLEFTSVPSHYRQKFNNLLRISSHEREIPVKSSSKSAATITNNSSSSSASE